MGLLTLEERSELIALLLKLPNRDNPIVRRELYVGLPYDLQAQIVDEGTSRTHIASIVNTVDNEAWVEPNGSSWPILQLIENAIYMVGRVSPVGHQLDLMLTNLTERTNQPLDKPSNFQTSDYKLKDLHDASDKEKLKTYIELLQEIERSLESTDRRNYTRIYIDKIINQLQVVNQEIYHLRTQTPIPLIPITEDLHRAEKELQAATALLESRDSSTGSSRSFYDHLSNGQSSLRSASDSLARFVIQLK